MVMYERNTAELKVLNKADTLSLSPAVQAKNAKRMCELCRLIENFKAKAELQISAKPPRCILRTNSNDWFTQGLIKIIIMIRN